MEPGPQAARPSVAPQWAGVMPLQRRKARVNTPGPSSRPGAGNTARNDQRRGWVALRLPNAHGSQGRNCHDRTLTLIVTQGGGRWRNSLSSCSACWSRKGPLPDRREGSEAPPAAQASRRYAVAFPPFLVFAVHDSLLPHCPLFDFTQGSKGILPENIQLSASIVRCPAVRTDNST